MVDGRNGNLAIIRDIAFFKRYRVPTCGRFTPRLLQGSAYWLYVNGFKTFTPVPAKSWVFRVTTPRP